MRRVYIAFLAADNYMGKFIRYFTRNEFSHVALSFDDSLTLMYSFARRQKKSPLVGGFVTETPARYFDMDGPVPLKIAEMSVEDSQYDGIRSLIAEYINRQDELIYNSADALFSLFGARVRIKDSHTCVSFVASLFGFDKVKRVVDIERIMQKNIIYSGDLKEYVKEPTKEASFYFKPLKMRAVAAGTLRHFCRLVARYVAGLTA